jgi:hypothetical protein
MTDLHDSDRRVIGHLMDVAEALRDHCPQSIIDWNHAIDAEVAARDQKLMDDMNARNDPGPRIGYVLDGKRNLKGVKLTKKTVRAGGLFDRKGIR